MRNLLRFVGLFALLLLLPVVASVAADTVQPLGADTPLTTTRGNSFVAPQGWTVEVRGDATIVAAPEGDSWIALVDLPEPAAGDADAAVAAAWKIYKPAAAWPLIVANDPGWTLRDLFQRKLLEVLFDGNPEADARMAPAAKSYYEDLAAGRKLLTVPADPAAAAALAARYVNPALGFVKVVRDGARTIFDFGEYSSEVASRKNPDGTTSFSTIAPGIVGLEFVVGAGDEKTLVMRDAQHEYVFEAR